MKSIDAKPADSSEHQMLDIERGKILESLKSSQRSGRLVSTSGASSNSSHHVHSFKWAFTLVILILGAAASATVLVIGIMGVHHDSKQDFLHEASQLVSVMEFSWMGYETLALWIHESCHFDSFQDPPFLESVNSTSSNATYDDQSKNNKDMISSAGGFCSRAKFQHLYEHIRSLDRNFIAIQYIPNVTHSLRGVLEDESRLNMEQHKPDFNYSGIRDYLAYPNATFKAIVPSPERPFYFPIHYLEPMDRNEPALDLDMYSFRKEEIDTALTSMKPVLGPRAKLLQEDSPDVYAVSLIHPGYSTSLPGELSAADAVSKIVIRLPDLIEEAATATMSLKRAVYIYDETPKRTAADGGKPVFLAAVDILCHTNTSGVRTQLKREVVMDEIPNATHFFSTTIHAADHTWRVIIVGTEPDHDITFVVLGGVIIMLGCFILAIGFHTNLSRVAKLQQIKSLAEAEKSELALIQAKREMHLNDFIAHEVRYESRSKRASNRAKLLYSLFAISWKQKSTFLCDCCFELCHYHGTGTRTRSRDSASLTGRCTDY